MRAGGKRTVGARVATVARSGMSLALACGLGISVATACGGTSSTEGTKPAAPNGGESSAGTGLVGTSGGTAATHGGSAAVSGGTTQESAGAPPGDGGSTDATHPTPLGGACSPPGSLACAGSHQKLTLVCSAKKTWEVNQTCSEGEFCDSMSGPNLGICTKPPPECLGREPGALVCSANSLAKCGPDSVTSEIVEQCAHGCSDGACKQLECPTLLFSCDPDCHDSASGCYDLCAGVDAAAEPPLLDLANAKVGEVYRLALPVFSKAPACACAGVSPALDAVAFRLPEPPAGLSWKIEAPPPWGVNLNEYKYLAGTAHANGCDKLSLGLSCHVSPVEAIVWIGTFKVSAEPAQVIVTLGQTHTTYCE